MVIGNFNEILFASDKEGGAPHHRSRLQAFQDALSDYMLEDIGYEGDKFTWFRGGLRERLDRAVANAGWVQLHPHASLCNLEMGKSNHRPICLDMEHLAGVADSSPIYKMKFEARWLSEETVEEVVKTAW